MAIEPEKLLKRARSFDQAALGEIYDQFSDALFAYAFKQVVETQVAEDLVAETFKRFLIALERGGGPKEHLRAYLYRITHNLITDLYRREPPQAWSWMRTDWLMTKRIHLGSSPISRKQISSVGLLNCSLLNSAR